MSHHLLLELVVIVLAASVIAYVSSRLRQLPIVGFLIAGVAIGPHALGLVTDLELIDAVAEIGVILLLFTLGIEFSLERLGKMKRVILLGGGIQLVATMAVGAGIVYALGQPLRVAVFTGALLALSSTAIVLKVLAARGEQSTEKGQTSIGILIFQDLSIILLVLLIPVLGGGADSPLEIAIAIGTAATLIAVVLVVARKLLPPLLEIVARTCSPEIFILSIIGICLGITYLTSLTGVSLSLGAFIAGIVVSESRFSHHALTEILPLQILFSAAFFVSVGMLLDLEVVAAQPVTILVIVVSILLIKIATTWLAAATLRLPFAVAAPTALLLAQVGEFSFVLERAGRAYDLSPGGLGSQGTQFFIASTVVLMVLTPLLAKLGEKLEKRAPTPARAAAPGGAAPIHGPSGHVIIAGYGNAARYLARVLRDTGIPFVVVTLSPRGMTEVEQDDSRVIGGDYAKRAILEEAGVREAKVIVIPDDDLERAVQVTSVVKALNPAIRVIVRTRRVDDLEELTEAGADLVVPEELEAAVELFGSVLTEYEIADEAVSRYKNHVRADHYASVINDTGEPIVVCEELDESCLDRRRVTIGNDSSLAGKRAGRIAADIEVVQIERAGELIKPDTATLRPGDQVIFEGAADSFVRLFDDLSRRQGDSWVELTEEQRQTETCNHAGTAKRFISPPRICPQCREKGDSWVHLRICMLCGQVGCCDSSKNKHASSHATHTGHPLIRSIEAGEDWVWCFEDEMYL